MRLSALWRAVAELIPYYDHGGITLYHCAWEDLLPTLAANSVGLLLGDPNYGTTNLEWDTPWDWPRFWKESNRACLPTALQILFSAQPFTTDLINSNRANYRYELIWRKTMPTGFLDANRRPLRAHENIEVFCREPGKSTYHPQMRTIEPTADHWGAPNKTQAVHYGKYEKTARLGLITERYPVDVWDFSNGHAGDCEHETPKPLALVEQLIASYSNPGDLVCDPGFGRGTTARACKNLGRRFVGCELREVMCAKAARWLAQEVLPLEAVS